MRDGIDGKRLETGSWSEGLAAAPAFPHNPLSPIMEKEADENLGKKNDSEFEVKLVRRIRGHGYTIDESREI